MKSLLNGIILTLFLTQICFAQWYWQNPLPQGNTISSISFVDVNNGFMVGLDGTILKTTNGGDDWEIKASGTKKQLLSVIFVDENNGWIVGQDGLIIKTSDGGDNWTHQTSNTFSWLNSVYFIDSSTGWI